jgi:hypothetical protein
MSKGPWARLSIKSTQSADPERSAPRKTRDAKWFSLQPLHLSQQEPTSSMPVHSVQHLLLDSAFHRCTHASMKSNQPSISGPHTSQRGFLPLLLLTMAPPFSQAKQVRISNYFKHVLPTISHIHRSPNLHFHSNSHFNTHTPGLLHDMLLLDSLTYPSTFVSKCILLSITVFLSCSLPDF